MKTFFFLYYIIAHISQSWITHSAVIEGKGRLPAWFSRRNVSSLCGRPMKMSRLELESLDGVMILSLSRARQSVAIDRVSKVAEHRQSSDPFQLAENASILRNQFDCTQVVQKDRSQSWGRNRHLRRNLLGRAACVIILYTDAFLSDKQ